MSRVDRTISTSENDIETSSESREEIHYIKEIECEKRVEETKPKIRSKPITKSKMYYRINKPINRENKVVEWLRNNNEYHAINEPDLDIEREIIRPNGTIRQHGKNERYWLEEILNKIKKIEVERPKPIRFIPRMEEDEIIQTQYEMIPKRNENVTLEMRLRNTRPEIGIWKEDEEIKYEIVPPEPVDLTRLMNQKKKK